MVDLISFATGFQQGVVGDPWHKPKKKKKKHGKKK